MHVVFVREAPPTISPPYVLRTTSQFFLRNHGARPAQGAGILPMFVPYATASPFHLRPPPGSSGKMRDRHRVGAGQGTDPPPPNTNCLNRQSGSHKDRGKHIMGSANPWAVPYNNLDSHSLSLYPSIPLSLYPALHLSFYSSWWLTLPRTKNHFVCMRATCVPKAFARAARYL